MQESIPQPSADAADSLDLGMLLGQNLAFGMVAGRCSAAQAEALRRLREEKVYKRRSTTWKEFCPQYLNMSSSQADRIIRLWEEFGAGYFELAQLTRISSETYRAVEPAVKEGALHFNGDVIELDPRNAEKVASAVAELRRNMPAPEPRELEMSERLDALEKRCAAVLIEFDAIARQKCEKEDWDRFAIVLNCASALLRRIEIENHLRDDDGGI